MIRIFVTYAWGNEKENMQVISFVDFLRRNGFDASCDIAETCKETAASFTSIMSKGLNADKIIVVLSESYKKKAMITGSGVWNEYKVISANIGIEPQRYILVSFVEVNISSLQRIVPPLFTSHEIVDLYKDEKRNFQTLIAKLRDEPHYVFSPVGTGMPAVQKIDIPAFSLNGKKRKKRMCIGYEEKKGKCTNILESDKVKLCKECSYHEFYDIIKDIYTAQGYLISGQRDNSFLVTYVIGIETFSRLVIIHHKYLNDKWDSNDVLLCIEIKSKYKDKPIYTSVVSNLKADINIIETLEKNDIEYRTLTQLTNTIMNFSIYFENFRYDYERSSLFKHYIDIYIKDKNVLGEKYVNKFLESLESNVLLILGEYGSGKTSFCSNLVYKLMQEYDRNYDSYIPIIVYLRDYSKAIDIYGLLTDYLVNRFDIRNGSVKNFKLLAKYRRILLIFDGFDEVAKRVDFDVKYKVFSEICQFASPNVKILITCRPNYFQDRAEYDRLFLSSYLHYEPINLGGIKIFRCFVEDLKPKQIDAFIRSYENDLRKYNINATTMINYIRETHDLTDLSKRPFLLNLIVQTLPKIIQDGGVGENGINAANLYEEYTKSWIDREDHKGKTLIRAADKIIFCHELAFSMYVTDKQSLHYSELPESIIKYFNRLKNISDIDYFSHDIRSCSYLTSDEEGNISFIHKSFMEYFVAAELTNKLIDLQRKNVDNNLEIDAILGLTSFSIEIFLFVRDILVTKNNAYNTALYLHYKLKSMSKQSFSNSMSILAKISDNYGLVLKSFNHCDLENMEFSYANIRDCAINNIAFRHTNFYKCKFTNVSFTDCIFESSTFQDSHFNNVSFADQCFSFSDFTNATLVDCDLSGCDFSESMYNGTMLYDCFCANADFSGMFCDVNSMMKNCEGLERVIGMPYEMKILREKKAIQK